MLKAALERTSSEMEARLGVTGQQRFILRFVGLAPGIHRDALARAICVDADLVDADLHQLVAANLLVEDRAASGYHLTAKGAGINAMMTGTIEEAVSKASDEASPYERASFQRMLQRVVGHLAPPR